MKKLPPASSAPENGGDKPRPAGPSTRVTDFLQLYARATKRLESIPDSTLAVISLN